MSEHCSRTLSSFLHVVRILHNSAPPSSPFSLSSSVCCMCMPISLLRHYAWHACVTLDLVYILMTFPVIVWGIFGALFIESSFSVWGFVLCVCVELRASINYSCSNKIGSFSVFTTVTYTYLHIPKWSSKG